MPPEIIVLSTVRALVEVAVLTLLLRGLIWTFGTKARASFIYGLVTAGSMPFIRLARAITPRALPDRYTPLIALLLLLSLWVALALTVQALCAGSALRCA